MRDRIERMINIFGQREMEIAAIFILDAQWEKPFERIDKRIFKGDTLALEGFECLKKNQWILPDGTPTRSFWERVHGR